MLRQFLFIFLIIFSAFITAEVTEPNGTLVITYQTGAHAERLDRVRFLLINEKGEQTMYPKRNGYVDDISGLMRMVVIENLKPGKYTLEFIIPNGDGLFGMVPSRSIVIENEKTIKVDQQIPINYASMKATYIIEGDGTMKTHPLITLKNSEGKVCCKSTKGVLESSHIQPGDYTLIFTPVSGYVAPPQMPISLLPNKEQVALTGVYKKAATLKEKKKRNLEDTNLLINTGED